MRVAVFLSGSGTNFIAVYEEGKRLAASGGKHYAAIGAVFHERPRMQGGVKSGRARNPGPRASAQNSFSPPSAETPTTRREGIISMLPRPP